MLRRPPESTRTATLFPYTPLVELLLQFLAKVAAGVQARDLVLVLVGHELEEVAGHGFGEVGRAARLRLLGGAHLRHEVGVAPRVRRVLVVDEEGGAAGAQFDERAPQATSNESCRERVGQ